MVVVSGLSPVSLMPLAVHSGACETVRDSRPAFTPGCDTSGNRLKGYGMFSRQWDFCFRNSWSAFQSKLTLD